VAGVPKDVSSDSLRATAWEQGSLIPAGSGTPAALWAHPDTQAVKAAVSHVKALRRREEVTAPQLATREFRDRERLVVISQTCDIIKPADQLPQVEAALVIATENQRIITDGLDFGSARYHLLARNEDGFALVLDYAWRVFLDKGFLVEADPDNIVLDGWDDVRRKTFARWLARRYGRPVLSDRDVAEIAEPVRQRWRQLRSEEADAASRYAAEFPEFRFRREIDGSLTLFILSVHERPDEELALEVAGLLTEVLEPIHGVVQVDPAKRSYYTFTKADELSTEQIDLEWASHDEGDPTGELPPAY
jgi:hypothetical protein